MALLDVARPLLPHLAACVTFFFNRERLVYLTTVVSNYLGLATKTDIYIITNVGNADTREEISAALPAMPDSATLHFVTPTQIGHPYLLTWTHREIFLEIERAKLASHFLYSEDDLAITYDNVAYWLRVRERLRPYGFIPSFFRVEQHPVDGHWYSTDCKSTIKLFRQARLDLEGSTYICPSNPYQGTYLMDRELMEEFSTSPAFSPDFGYLAIREKAAQGLTFANVPPGFSSRNLLLVDLDKQRVPEETWVHHLPNNYVSDPSSPFGKVPMSEVLVTSRAAFLQRKLRRLLAG